MTSNSRQLRAHFLRKAIRPLASFCIRRGIKIQEFEECTKAAFIDAASAELNKQGSDVSNSRLSEMIGLHRRDVTRITTNPETDKSQGILLMRLIGQWQQDQRFFLQRGIGRPLTFEGKNSEFVKLVSAVSKNLNPYTLLFELERLGAVKKRADRLELLVDALQTKGDVSEGLRILSQDIADLLYAVEENLFEEQDDTLYVPNLHSRTFFDNIQKSKVPEIKKWILEQGSIFHKKVRNHLANFDADLNPSIPKTDAGQKFSVTTFSYNLSVQPKDEETIATEASSKNTSKKNTSVTAQAKAETKHKQSTRSKK